MGKENQTVRDLKAAYKTTRDALQLCREKLFAQENRTRTIAQQRDSYREKLEAAENEVLGLNAAYTLIRGSLDPKTADLGRKIDDLHAENAILKAKLREAAPKWNYNRPPYLHEIDKEKP